MKDIQYTTRCTGFFQRGMSINEMMLLLVLIGFFATAAIKLVPVYLENRTVQSALESVKEDYYGKDIQEISNSSIQAKLGKYFQVNMTGVEAMQSITIDRKGRSIYVRSDYEVRKPFMGNIDLVLRFQNEVDLAD